MHTNLDYENASTAIGLIKSGMNINDAASEANAKIQLINIMLGNEDIITEAVFVEDSVRIQRESICNACDQNKFNTCMECACPLPTIVNMKFKECPLGKW
jgi:hypothetical protein